MSSESNLHKTVDFLQEFVDEALLDLQVSMLSEDDFESLVRDKRSVLNWLSKFGHFLSEDSFHMGFRLEKGSEIDGAVLGVYATKRGDLHIFLIESFVRDLPEHPLNGRLTTLVIIAVTFFLTQYPDSKAVYIIEPDEGLISHYQKFGFKLLRDENVMFATSDALQLIQLSLLTELLSNQ
ncbi:MULTISPECIES: hypothetical protein [Providencia]|uniref:hypothetical protein n=1 Tax=Providencia TaxID=586 RepID=UPI001182AC13|nr:MULTISPECIES: hypothetical protein [Providencia]EHZ6873041.1 hypothetical protein [Providencia rettgeri]MBG5927664.1 hypothetical protein [Providencia rettgeri]WIE07935.1 hypothetical protein N4838_019045 [Providencia rettgeri]